MTGQNLYASDVGLAVAIDLANLAGVRSDEHALRGVLAVDPDSLARTTATDIGGLFELVEAAAAVAQLLVEGDVDGAAAAVNASLGRHPAQLYLAREAGRWRLHNHRPDAPPVEMWGAIVAGAFARLIGEGRQDRLGACVADSCGRFFYDLSKNASRRFCSLACQNRTKAAAYRARRQA